MRPVTLYALLIVGIVHSVALAQIWTTGEFKPVELIPGTEDIDVAPEWPADGSNFPKNSGG